MMDQPFLEINHVSKTFPGVKALDDIQMEVRKGEVHALIGENGAGKSTLIKILAGLYQPDEGARIIIEGREAANLTPLTALRRGITVIYQDFSLFPNLSVAENIALGLSVEEGNRFLNWERMNQTAGEALARLGVRLDLQAPLGGLSVAKQQLVAIARALVHKTKLIIMDEPTASLSKTEVESLFGIIGGIKASGIAIVFVSHKLEELFAIADRFTVLRDGKYIGTYRREELDNEKLIALMVGRTLTADHYAANAIGPPLLEVRNLSKKGNFKDISFTLHAGEIVALTGLVGAGRTELAQALCGIERPDSGAVLLAGRPLTLRSPEAGVAQGIAYVPENRQSEGLIVRQTIEDNITITVLRQLVNRFALIRRERKHAVALEWIKTLNIKPPYPEMTVQQLSGGNQQRVVIAKWLAIRPKVLIIDEPTHGIDVGAKTEIHQLLRKLASEGIGILMISSELPEVLAISDKILVMRRGRINGEFGGGQATQEAIMNKAILEDQTLANAGR